MLVVARPEPKRHDRDGFACGDPTLDAYRTYIDMWGVRCCS